MRQAEIDACLGALEKLHNSKDPNIAKMKKNRKRGSKTP